MAKYTPDEVRTIIAGLASGKRPGYRPMTDAQFLERYDPPSRHEALILEVLHDIKEIMASLDAPIKQNQTYQTFKPAGGANPTGPVALQ